MKQAKNFILRHRLVWEGILVGLVAGGISVLYRFLLGFAETTRGQVLSFFGKSVGMAAVWILCLAGIAWIVSCCLKKEPMISGSGIPQIEGEVYGKFQPKPVRVIFYKMLGGFLSVFGGLSLGREGPSIQLGGMGGKWVSNTLNRNVEEKNYLLTCGASAGLSAAFNAPLAGVLFAIEETHKTVSPTLLFGTMISSVTADIFSKCFFGMSPVFSFPMDSGIVLQQYWLLVLIGVVTGVLGAGYNRILLFSQTLYRKIKNPFVRLLIPFLLAGCLGFYMPEILGGGHEITQLLTPQLGISVLVILLVAKFLFSMLSFGSGAPGGIFFPLLVIGACLGGIFGNIAVMALGLEPQVFYQFVVLAMAGYFTAIVHAPITGIILLCEMTGGFQNILPITAVCIVSYITTDLCKNQPIYDSLRERME